jgi:hypothetical protein
MIYFTCRRGSTYVQYSACQVNIHSSESQLSTHYDRVRKHLDHRFGHISLCTCWYHCWYWYLQYSRKEDTDIEFYAYDVSPFKWWRELGSEMFEKISVSFIMLQVLCGLLVLVLYFIALGRSFQRNLPRRNPSCRSDYWISDIHDSIPCFRSRASRRWIVSLSVD